MTVLQNCIDPLLMQGISSAQATERALSILAQLGVAEKKDSYPHTLSGGQQQRVAIARAHRLCNRRCSCSMNRPLLSILKTPES